MKTNTRFAHANVITIIDRELSNADIVEGVLKGDPRAGKALVTGYGPVIESRVWRMMGGDSEHRDVVQQVFQQLVATLDRLSDSQALPAWVETVTVNVVRKEFRRRKKSKHISYTDTVPDETPNTDAARHVPESNLLLARAFRILEDMKIEERIVFTLRFIEGLPLDNVATAANCSLATAKRRIRRSHDSFMKKAGRDPFLFTMLRRDDVQ